MSPDLICSLPAQETSQPSRQRPLGMIMPLKPQACAAEASSAGQAPINRARSANSPQPV